MENYEVVANQSYDSISKEIGNQINFHQTREMRYLRVTCTQLMYNAYTLRGNEVPLLQEFKFVGVGNKKELADILLRELRREALPEEIRVIRPDSNKNIWGIFFK